MQMNLVLLCLHVHACLSHLGIPLHDTDITSHCPSCDLVSCHIVHQCVHSAIACAFDPFKQKPFLMQLIMRF